MKLQLRLKFPRPSGGENGKSEQNTQLCKQQTHVVDVDFSKEQDAKKRDEEISQAEHDNKNSARNLESKAINRILRMRNLGLYQIKSDGDCLYNAIRYQLELAGVIYSADDLRRIAAEYIRANQNELICYMTSSQDDEIMSQKEFDDYCHQVENTKAWGSQIEIQALSNSLKVKIEVLQASGTPTISGSEFERPHLIVTYHRHFFGLGEHYNSTRPLPPNPSSKEPAAVVAAMTDDH